MFLSYHRLRAARLALIAGASLFLFTPTGFAADQAPPAPAAATAEPTPSHLAAARELVTVSGMSRSFDAAIPDMMNKIADTYKQARPDVLPDLVAVLNMLKPEFAKRTEDVADKAAHIYAKLLTEEQLRAAIAFFTSDAGKKYVAAEPVFFNAVINAMQDWHDKVYQDLAVRIRQEMKKKGHDL